MSPQGVHFELRCPACSWSEQCGPAAAARWLGRAGKVRAGREPEPAILFELLRVTAPRLACPGCGAVGLAAGPAADDEIDWPGPKPCAGCSRPISQERLEAMPGATLCAECQGQEERGGHAGEGEYCPKCGSLMELRLSRAGGITRYAMACTANPPCRL